MFTPLVLFLLYVAHAANPPVNPPVNPPNPPGGVTSTIPPLIGPVNTTQFASQTPPFYITTVTGKGSFNLPGVGTQNVNYPTIPIVAPADQCINKSINLDSGGDSEKLCCTCGTNKTPLIQTFTGRGCQGNPKSETAPTPNTYQCGGISQFTNVEVSADAAGVIKGCGQTAGTVPMALNVCVNSTMLNLIPAIGTSVKNALLSNGVQSYKYVATCSNDGNLTATLVRYTGTSCNGAIERSETQRIGGSGCLKLLSVNQQVTVPAPQPVGSITQNPMVDVFTRAKDLIYNGKNVAGQGCVIGAAGSGSVPTTTTKAGTTSTPSPKSGVMKVSVVVAIMVGLVGAVFV